MADLHDLTALEQGVLVRRGEVSSRELVDHYLERAERLDDVGAFVTLTADRARSQAASVGASVMAGSAAGPLAGVRRPSRTSTSSRACRRRSARRRTTTSCRTSPTASCSRWRPVGW